MQRTFKCNICNVKLTVIGTSEGIKKIHEQFLESHRHKNVSDVTMASELAEKVAPLLAPGLSDNRASN